MRIRAVLRWFLPSKSEEEVRPGHFMWHEIDPPLWRSFKLADGRRSQQTGRLWRRRTAAGLWEYWQDDETHDEFLDRQW